MPKAKGDKITFRYHGYVILVGSWRLLVESQLWLWNFNN